MKTFDLTIIGGGPGGYACAVRAAQLGLSVALVEKRKNLGGTCLNAGCIPSKALLESSELYHQTKNRLDIHGISTGDVRFDLSTMMKRKADIKAELADGISFLMKNHKVEVFTGAGSFLSKNRIVVTEGGAVTELEAKSIVVATGSKSVELPHLPFDGKYIVSSTEALSFDSVPEYLLVVGGGAIGLELGSVWLRLGAKVTVVEMLKRIAPFADKQMSQTLQRSLKKQGFEFKLGTQVAGASVEGNEIRVTVKDKKGNEETIVCDRLLVAVGRKPNTAGLDLDKVSLEVDEHGRIPVDGDFRARIPGIYAIGDVIEGPMLAHKASEEGVAVAEIIAGLPRHVNYGTIPNIVFTRPELAQVGLSEEEAKDKGLEYKVGKYYYKGSGRAKTMNESDGLVKIIADKKTDRLIGVHIVGAHASDLIAEALIAFELGACAENIGNSIHAHPTLSEIVKEAALAVNNRSAHG